MFATYGGLRRRVAVLMVLSLVASVLVAAAPVSAADDPKPSYPATFDACAGVSESGFTDVPAGHANAGDIDCIAYYGITKGTSATTYSPTSAVTREQMALFLMRLANLVGITVPPAGDTGFTDVGDLSAESQAAISQLAQLEITQGTSDTTFSPADGVRRDHMALFVQRLMNIMDPLVDGNNDYGHTPSDVKGDVGSPYTDLSLVTKSAYDAITELYELGVASGISGTAYGPSSLITRGSMAGFMAALLDHSNVRLAGLSIQASKTSGWGPVTGATVIVFYRDDSFMPIADQPIDVFNSEKSDALDRKGACDSSNLSAGNCTWNDNDELTDDNGNIIDKGAGATVGATNVFYAWIGTEDNDTFDKDDADYVTASIASMKDEKSVEVTTDLPDNVSKVKVTKVTKDGKTTVTTTSASSGGYAVNLRETSTVTITLQLKDDKDASGGDIVRPGIEFQVGTTMGTDNTTNAATLTTDNNGQAVYTVTGPRNGADEDQDDSREDVITFTYKGDVVDYVGEKEVKISWIEESSKPFLAIGDADDYVLKGSDVRVSASVTYYDQYGEKYNDSANPIKVTIKIGTDKEGKDLELRSNGTVAYSPILPTTTDGKPVIVSFMATGTTVQPKQVDPVQVVAEATPSVADSTKDYTVHSVFADNNKFTTGDQNAKLLFSYDSDDTFLEDTTEINMTDFEGKLSKNDTVDVVSYSDTGGRSIFVLKDKDK